MHLLFSASEEVGQPLLGGNIHIHTNVHTTIDGAGATVLLCNTNRWITKQVSLTFPVSKHTHYTGRWGEAVSKLPICNNQTVNRGREPVRLMTDSDRRSPLRAGRLKSVWSRRGGSSVLVNGHLAKSTGSPDFAEISGSYIIVQF